MDSETLCRDTDPIKNANIAVKGETLAFTIEFGDQDNNEEKAKKFERFAQRSSQRQVNSLRLDKINNESEETNKQPPNPSEEKPRANVSRVSRACLKVIEQNSFRSVKTPIKKRKNKMLMMK